MLTKVSQSMINGSPITVIAKYRTTGSPLSDVSNSIDFAVPIADDFGLVTTGQGVWKFTVNAAAGAGFYFLAMSHNASGVSATSAAYKNGVVYDYLCTSPFTAGNGIVSGSTGVFLDVGDFVDVRLDSFGFAPNGNITIFKIS